MNPLAFLSGATALKSLFSGFGGDPNAHRNALIDAAAARGDVGYLVAWINDQPPHPNETIARARSRLAAMTGGTAYGGRLANTTPAPALAGYLPVTMRGTRLGIPLYR